MSNHTIRVVDNQGDVWPALTGVFRRVFAVVCGNVIDDGQPRGVTYHGDSFTIERAKRQN